MLWALTTVRRRIHSPEMPGTRTSPALKCVHEGARTAKPKSILKLMNVDGVTKANIKSHLQKYRCLIATCSIGWHSDKEFFLNETV